jgi:hypothetical protein
MAKMCKAPTWRAYCQRFKLAPTSKFLYVRLRHAWCAQSAQELYWFTRNVPNPVFSFSRYRHLIARSKGYKQAGEGEIPSLCMWCHTSQRSFYVALLVVSWFSFCALSNLSVASPFIDQGGGVTYGFSQKRA